MTRSCHGLLTYFRPRGHESLASENRASVPRMSGSGNRTPGGGSAGRGPALGLGPGVGTTTPPAPAVVNAPMFDHGPARVRQFRAHAPHIALGRAQRGVDRIAHDARCINRTRAVGGDEREIVIGDLEPVRQPAPPLTLAALAGDGGQRRRQTDIRLLRTTAPARSAPTLSSSNRPAFKAALDSVTALGSTGERIPPSHAIAAAAHITIAHFPQLNSIRHVSSIYMGRFILARVPAVARLMNDVGRSSRSLP